MVNKGSQLDSRNLEGRVQLFLRSGYAFCFPGLESQLHNSHWLWDLPTFSLLPCAHSHGHSGLHPDLFSHLSPGLEAQTAGPETLPSSDPSHTSPSL